MWCFIAFVIIVTRTDGDGDDSVRICFFHRIECLIGHEGKRHLPLALELGFMVYPSLDDQPLHNEAS